MAIQLDPVQRQQQSATGCFCHRKGEKIDLLTPRGILLHLMPLDVCFDEQQASCAIRKDGGDDPDATDGLLVYAVVSKCGKTKEEQVFIDGGKGVGRITKPGLEQPVGAAAIQPCSQRDDHGSSA